MEHASALNQHRNPDNLEGFIIMGGIVYGCGTYLHSRGKETASNLIPDRCRRRILMKTII